MKIINKLIPIAIDKINESNIFEKNSKIIPREYKSYVSSFGSSVMQSGLLPALAFYHANSEVGKKRVKIMTIIFNILKNNNKNYYNTEQENLFEFTQKRIDNERQIKKDIMNAAIAVKLAIRTYKFSKND